MKKKINIDSIDFEVSLENALKSYGFLFPETDEQMDILEHAMEIVELPEKFQNPSFIFENKKKLNRSINLTIDNSIGESNWAIAAREGKDIPSEILEKMRKDKEEAKKNHNGDK